MFLLFKVYEVIIGPKGSAVDCFNYETDISTISLFPISNFPRYIPLSVGKVSPAQNYLTVSLLLISDDVCLFPTGSPSVLALMYYPIS